MHIVFYAVAPNTMHKGYYIFVHLFNTPDYALVATPLFPQLALQYWCSKATFIDGVFTAHCGIAQSSPNLSIII